MPIRVGRPGLIGTMARTAVIAGTAQAVQGNVARRQHARWQAQAEPAPQPVAAAPAAPPPPPAPASSGGEDLMAQLSRLADMRAAGILTDAEFAAAKARLLG